MTHHNGINQHLAGGPKMEPATYTCAASLNFSSNSLSNNIPRQSTGCGGHRDEADAQLVQIPQRLFAM